MKLAQYSKHNNNNRLLCIHCYLLHMHLCMNIILRNILCYILETVKITKRQVLNCLVKSESIQIIKFQFRFYFFTIDHKRC